jgi:hypothetical protein
MDRLENICATVFKTALTDNNAQRILEDVCKKYPYFATAQFCLNKVTPQHDNFNNESLHKTALLFNNNHWLNYQLYYSNIDAQNAVLQVVNAVAIVDENLQNELQTHADDVETKSILPIFNVNENKQNDTSFEEQSVENIEDTIDVDNTDKVSEIIDTTMAENNVSNILSNELAVSELTNNLVISTPDSVDTLLFEPLHTTDYFASVGIKITDEHKPNDKLGLQLKSFTAWLKTMKKVHVVEDTSNTATDITIQTLADKSNTEADVVTEAMANILIQQGSIKKAIEVLEKLSLLNPAKSTYFVTQINQLNKS